jgi:hypothetical protein
LLWSGRDTCDSCCGSAIHRTRTECNPVRSIAAGLNATHIMRGVAAGCRRRTSPTFSPTLIATAGDRARARGHGRASAIGGGHALALAHGSATGAAKRPHGALVIDALLLQLTHALLHSAAVQCYAVAVAHRFGSVGRQSFGVGLAVDVLGQRSAQRSAQHSTAHSTAQRTAHSTAQRTAHSTAHSAQHSTAHSTAQRTAQKRRDSAAADGLAAK